MKLAKFLQLSEDEKIQNQTIKVLQKIPNRQIFYNSITRYPTELILKMAIIDPEINQICNSPELTHYWKEFWRQSGTNPTELAELNGEPVKEYSSMYTTCCFELLKGLYLYNAYQNLLEKKPITQQVINKAEEYLHASAQYGCFFAINALCIHGLTQLKSSFDPLIATKIINYANLASKLYLSPGYLLLSNVYQELIPYQNKPLFERSNLRFNAFQAVVVAKKLEKISAPMINNAYQGKTLSEASNGKISSFAQAELRLQKFLQLNYSELELVYKHANDEAAQIKTAFFVHLATLVEEEKAEVRLDNLMNI